VFVGLCGRGKRRTVMREIYRDEADIYYKRESKMRETQKTISDWARKTFGDPKIEPLYEKFCVEVVELQEALAKSKSGEFELTDIRQELADCHILLVQIADYFGQNLNQCVDEKMNANRDRTWKISGDGTGQHIKTGC